MGIQNRDYMEALFPRIDIVGFFAVPTGMINGITFDINVNAKLTIPLEPSPKNRTWGCRT